MSEKSEKIITMLIGAVIGTLISGLSTYYVTTKFSQREEVFRMLKNGIDASKDYTSIPSENAMIIWLKEVVKSKHGDLSALTIPVLDVYIWQREQSKGIGLIKEAKELRQLAKERQKQQ